MNRMLSVKMLIFFFTNFFAKFNANVLLEILFIDWYLFVEIKKKIIIYWKTFH